MKLIFILLLLTPLLFPAADSVTTEKIRLKYYLAVENEEAVEELENFIISHFKEDVNNYPPIILAYMGGVEALKGKHAFNPFNKLSYLLSGLDLLEEAVSKKPNDLEIRFMRFSILHYVPGIIGYGSERDADMRKIVSLLAAERYSDLPSEIIKGIIDFMIDSGRLSSDQERKLRSYYNNLSS